MKKTTSINTYKASGSYLLSNDLNHWLQLNNDADLLVLDGYNSHHNLQTPTKLKITPHLLTLTGLILSSLVFSTASSAALSATAANTIKGTAPKFVTAGANAVDLTDFKYFGLSYGGIDYYTPLQLGAALDAVGAKAATTKPSDLYGSATPTYPLTLAPLGTPITAEINDSDGDGATPAPITELSASSVTLGWYYKNGGTETALTGGNLNRSFCDLVNSNILPYLKISGGINLNTTYGDPTRQSYPDTTVGLTTTPARQFTISLSASICGARPDMGFFTTYPGPANEWSTTFGFLPQPTGTPNFPTTGADGLYFDLIIYGVDATTLKWPGFSAGYNALTDNGIQVEVTAVTASNVTVKLTGPTATTTAAAAQATKPIGGNAFTSPASFTIEGLDGSTPKISYSFSINKWYINRGNVTKPATSTAAGVGDNQTSWCAGLDGTHYALSKVRELTNSATGPAAPAGFPTPLSSGNRYQRRIGGGLFTEWGSMGNYTGASFVSHYYWTSDTTGTDHFIADSEDGYVLTSDDPSNNVYAVCASRP